MYGLKKNETKYAHSWKQTKKKISKNKISLQSVKILFQLSSTFFFMMNSAEL